MTFDDDICIPYIDKALESFPMVFNMEILAL